MTTNTILDNFDLNYNPMNDVLFKFIFGSYKRKQITIDFLNTVLENSFKQLIADITFAPTEQTPGHEGDKLTRLDIACVLDSGEQVDIEVQIINEQDIPSRTLYYWAQMYVSSLRAGQTYHNLKPCITVNLLNFSFLPGPNAHSTYSICELETGHRLNRDLELHFLEVPKYAKKPQKPIKAMTKMERWLAYFANQLDKKEKEELAMSEKAIKEAMEAAQAFLSDTAGHRAYVNREMAIMDRQSQLETAHNQGLRQGKAEGEIKGREDERLQSIRSIMDSFGITAEKAMEALKIDKSLWKKYSALL